jgi:hypothetical protein
MLIQAASGLERLMYGNSNSDLIKDSNVAQISAALYYEANVIAKFSNSKKFKKAFTTTIFNQINKDFGEHIDSQSRSKPKSLHHVYEWKKVGNKNARLFKLNSIDGDGISFKINYELQPSKSFVPSPQNQRKHVFINKASIMEAGMPLIIAPRHSERLVFESNGRTVFMPKGVSVTVKRPGGPSVKNQFKLYYSRFFSGNLVNNSIKKSGFQQIFNSEIAKALKLPAPIKRVKYSFSPNSIRSMADSAIETSFGGSMI